MWAAAEQLMWAYGTKACALKVSFKYSLIYLPRKDGQPRVHYMHLGSKIFGVYLTFCRRSGVISSIKSVLGMTAFEN